MKTGGNSDVPTITWREKLEHARGISLRAGYDLYDRTEPQAGFEKLDTTFSPGLQISI